MRRLLRRFGPGPLVGSLLIAVFLFVAIFGPLLAPYPPTVETGPVLAGPSRAHLFGTDQFGFDLLSELLYGARVAAAISLTVVTLSLAIGLALGTLAGYLGGLLDDVLMRVVDILLAFPGILLNIAIVAMVARPGTAHLVFALTVNGWVGYARVARGQVLQLRDREFVQAARAIGASPLRVMARHVAPNVLGPLVIQATAGFAGVILTEATLAFLGVGRAAPYSWGALLDQGTSVIWQTQHLAVASGGSIAMVVLGCNLLGDGLRDHLDPRRARR